mmetsp:Transcript_5223/g.11592  ORF Transcript_5223/g.11592 Transcript_5223/m.11592 type:complete len:254 (-) Transcript_5223:71-832(-)
MQCTYRSIGPLTATTGQRASRVATSVAALDGSVIEPAAASGACVTTAKAKGRRVMTFSLSWLPHCGIMAYFRSNLVASLKNPYNSHSTAAVGHDPATLPAPLLPPSSLPPSSSPKSCSPIAALPLSASAGWGPSGGSSSSSSNSSPLLRKRILSTTPRHTQHRPSPSSIATCAAAATSAPPPPSAVAATAITSSASVSQGPRAALRPSASGCEKVKFARSCKNCGSGKTSRGSLRMRPICSFKKAPKKVIVSR